MRSIVLDLPSQVEFQSTTKDLDTQSTGWKVQLAQIRPPSKPVLACPLILPCGEWFYRSFILNESIPGNTGLLQKERLHQSNTLGDSAVQIEDYSKQRSDETFEHLFEENESASLLRLDPTKWKDQDHYKVLGLGKMRYKATDEDLKRAYRKKVLKHHPDKKSENEGPRDDNFFKCVQKAYEFLSDPVKRRQYDSIDPSFDDEIPSKVEDPSKFYDAFNSIFARNAYFSKKQPVPSFGDANSSREQVEAFYNFWSSFESWRTFELLDEENPDNAENREERRWIEKQNRAERIRRKKQESARLLKLLDTAMRLDPRVQKFKDESKAAKEAKRLAREAALKKAEEEARAAEEAARLEKQRHEEELKRQQESAKKAKEERKRQIKMGRKAIRTLLDQRYDYFSAGEQTKKDSNTKKVEELYQFIGDDVQQLELLSEALEKCSIADEAESLFDDEYQKMLIEKDMEKQREEKRLEELRRKQAEKEAQLAAEKNRPWTEEESKLLIKAANMFPGGTLNRWETIAEYVSQHLSVKYPPRGPDEMVRKSKELRQSSANINTQKFERRKNDFVINDAPTVKADENSPMAAQQSVKEAVTEKPWSASEQAQLEAALRKFPASQFKGAERWDKVAEMVEGRTKKEVIARVKELVKAVKAKSGN